MSNETPGQENLNLRAGPLSLKTSGRYSIIMIALLAALGFSIYMINEMVRAQERRMDVQEKSVKVEHEKITESVIKGMKALIFMLSLPEEERQSLEIMKPQFLREMEGGKKDVRTTTK